MIDPFTDEQAGLVSLASGIVLDDGVADRLLESESRGEEEQRLICPVVAYCEEQ